MPTPNPEQACPALTVLEGTMGTDDRGRRLRPSHQLPEPWEPHPHACRFCGSTVPKAARLSSSPRSDVSQV